MANAVDKSIEEEPVDRLVSLIRGGIGLIPGVGSVLSEVVCSLVPNQRVERITRFLVELESRIVRMEISTGQINDPTGIDLIEDGAFQAVRALTDQRIKLLANSVAEGLKASDKEKLNEKRILYIIAQIDEGDIQLLDAFDKRTVYNIRPDRAMYGSSEEILNEEALFQASIAKLERLSLLHFSIRMDRDNKAPKFDFFSGRPEGHHSINSLGRLLLRRANLAPD